MCLSVSVILVEEQLKIIDENFSKVKFQDVEVKYDCVAYIKKPYVICVFPKTLTMYIRAESDEDLEEFENLYGIGVNRY